MSEVEKGYPRGYPPEDDDKIDELMRLGHSAHCACRIVWGKEKCKCGFIKKQKKDSK